MCKKVFKEMSLLESHILKEHLSRHYFKTFDKEGYFRCNSCNKTFSNSQNLKNHHQSVHDENIFRGAVIFQNKWRNFEAHKKSIDGKKGYKCDECEKRFILSISLKLHKKSFHEKMTLGDSESAIEDLIHADKVDEVYPHKTEEHTETDIKVNPMMEKSLKLPKKYSCKLCNKSYTQSRNLKCHTKYVHENTTEFSCQFCDKTYAKSQSLRNHFKNVHEGINFGCSLCDKKFVKAQNLRNHIKGVHEGNKLFKCDYCGKSFSLSGILKNHIQTIHTDVNFRCESCYKTFSSPTNLKTHQKSLHYKIRFNCDNCSKSFSTSQNLKAHKKSVHENIYYNCDSCGKSFNQTKSLRRHKISVHQTITFGNSESAKVELIGPQQERSNNGSFSFYRQN